VLLSVAELGLRCCSIWEVKDPCALPHRSLPMPQGIRDEYTEHRAPGQHICYPEVRIAAGEVWSKAAFSPQRQVLVQFPANRCPTLWTKSTVAGEKLVVPNFPNLAIDFF